MGEIKGSGPEKQPIDFKTGRSGFTWKGLAPDTDPQDLPEDTPRQLTNMRLVGGRIESRGGQVQLCDLQHRVTGMHNHATGAERGIYLLKRLRQEFATNNGMGLAVFNEERESPYKSIGEYIDGEFTLDSGGAIGLFDSDVLYGFEDGLGPLSLKKIVTEDSKVQDIVVELPGTSYSTVSAIMEHEGVALVAAVGSLAAPTNDCAIFTWDGTTFTKELDSINRVLGFSKFRDTAVAIINSSPVSVRVRSSAGVWGAPITPVAGSISVENANACASYRDKLYIPAGEDILSFDGGSFTQIPIATTGITAGGSVRICVNFDGKLVFMWNDTPSGDVVIGTYDGTTWDESVKNLTSQIEFYQVFDMKVYKSSLWVSGRDVTDIPILVSSVFNDIVGTWVDRTPSGLASTDHHFQNILAY